MRAMRFFVGAATIALLLVIAVLIWVDRSTPVTVIVKPMPTQEIHVQVAGAVATPGVVVVAQTARLADVVNAAGGFTGDADVSTLNMAGRIGDGEKVLVPSTTVGVVAETLETSDAASPAPEAMDALLDINTATVSDLDQLPGIGDVLATRIVEYREANNGYSSIDELANVSGISARMVEELRPLVTVGDGR